MAKPDKALLNELEEPPPPRDGLGRWLLWGAVGVFAATGGFLLPQFWTWRSGAGKPDEPAPQVGEGPTGNQPALVPFGDPLVVNLNDDRLAKYLRVSFTLGVDRSDEETVKQAMEKNRARLKSWLITYLMDKRVDDVRGAIHVNRARREIREQFNLMLFPDGSEKVQEIFFEEFSVQ